MYYGNLLNVLVFLNTLVGIIKIHTYIYSVEKNQNIHMNNKTDVVGWCSKIPQITSNNA